MDIVLGVFLGVLLDEAVRFLLRVLHPQLGGGPLRPLPCIGQHWQLRGVGRVEIVGLRVNSLGLIHTVKYSYALDGESLLKGAALLDAFLDNGTLLESPEGVPSQ